MVAINEFEISALVEAFYVRVREDALIGPIFDRNVKDWPRHLILLKNFWATVLIRTGSYRGDPLAIHLRLSLEGEHFERWLALFAQTANELLSSQHATLVIRKSEQIAKNFQLAIAYKRDESDVHARP